MKKLILAVVTAALTLPAVPALAQRNQSDRQYNQDFRAVDRANRQQAKRDARQGNRDWRQYSNYDHNNFESGQTSYDASRYYRDHPSYQTRVLSSDDRIYRGRNSQYYCRRSDGTTGLIIGGVGGGILGNVIAPGGHGLLGTLLGAGGGALAGRAIDRNRSVNCR